MATKELNWKSASTLIWIVIAVISLIAVFNKVIALQVGHNNLEIRTEVQFGVVFDDIVKRDFFITNTTNSPLQIKSIRASCSCTNIEAQYKIIPPHSDCKISAAVKTHNMVGDFSTNAVVATSDGVLRIFTLNGWKSENHNYAICSNTDEIILDLLPVSLQRKFPLHLDLLASDASDVSITSNVDILKTYNHGNLVPSKNGIVHLVYDIEFASKISNFSRDELSNTFISVMSSRIGKEIMRIPIIRINEPTKFCFNREIFLGQMHAGEEKSVTLTFSRDVFPAAVIEGNSLQVTKFAPLAANSNCAQLTCKATPTGNGIQSEQMRLMDPNSGATLDGLRIYYIVSSP